MRVYAPLPPTTQHLLFCAQANTYNAPHMDRILFNRCLGGFRSRTLSVSTAPGSGTLCMPEHQIEICGLVCNEQLKRHGVSIFVTKQRSKLRIWEMAWNHLYFDLSSSVNIFICETYIVLNCDVNFLVP